MNLSAEQFADLLVSLAEHGLANKRDDKRRATRLTHHCQVPIMLGRDVQTGITTTVTVKDFSPRGMCILHTSELPRGSDLVIRLERSEGGPVHILATVAYCRPQDKTLFAIGAEFTCILDSPAAAAAAAATTTPESASEDLARIRQSVLED
jgi:hypothetical protein